MGENRVTLSGGFSWKLCVMLLVLIAVSDFGRGQDRDNPNPHRCLDTGNYTANSTYSANLNAALSALSLNTSQYGFYSAFAGQGEDRAHAVALCRTDMPVGQCRSCVRTAADELVQLCPNRKQAIRWYEYCMLHYSNHTVSDVRGGYLLENTANVSDPVQFLQDRTVLLDSLREQAANGSSLLKARAGSRNTSGSGNLIALLQCIPTLSSVDCDDCLNRAEQGLPPAAQGARLLYTSCNIRYELYPFYNETRLQELNVLPRQTPNSPPGTTDGNNNNTSSNNNNNARKKKDDNTMKIVVAIVVPVAVCLILAACAVFFLRKRMKKPLLEIPEPLEEISTVESLQYDFRQISAATNDFAEVNKLGQGGFGAVYKGKLLNDQEIAVKRLSRDSGQGNKEFMNEVLLMANLQHKNLVRLLGFSLQGTERLLIYEYIPNKSLDQFIFDPIKSSQLDWGIRYKIIGGIARGLVYLHEDSRLKIIHRDLKASNILLDGEMNPKIADFGMARLFEQGETQGNTSKIVGTYGYMSPEYAIYGQFSIKSDVFSFGVLLLEIISGQRNITVDGEDMQDILSIVWKNWCEGKAEDMIDPVLRDGSGSIREMFRCIHIALLCVQENVSDRPTMNSVMVMLSSSTVTLPVPLQPAFMTSNNYSIGFQDSGFSKESGIKTYASEGSSQNEMSVSEFHPR